MSQGPRAGDLTTKRATAREIYTAGARPCVSGYIAILNILTSIQAIARGHPRPHPAPSHIQPRRKDPLLERAVGPCARDARRERPQRPSRHGPALRAAPAPIPSPDACSRRLWEGAGDAHTDGVPRVSSPAPLSTVILRAHHASRAPSLTHRDVPLHLQHGYVAGEPRFFVA